MTILDKKGERKMKRKIIIPILVSVVLLLLVAALLQPGLAKRFALLGNSLVLAKDGKGGNAADQYTLLEGRFKDRVQPGWLHIREHRFSDVDIPDFGSFGEANPIPTESMIETWIHVDDAGMIDRLVTIQTAMDGRVVQAGVTSDGTGWNTAADEFWPREVIPVFFIDHGLSRFLDNPDLHWKQALNDRQEKMVIFELSINEPKKPQLQDYLVPLKAMAYQFTFAEETGFITSVQRIARLTDGSERIHDVIDIEIWLNEVPPEEVLVYFTMKQEREAAR